MEKGFRCKSLRELLGIQSHLPERHIALQQIRPVHIHFFTGEYQFGCQAIIDLHVRAIIRYLSL